MSAVIPAAPAPSPAVLGAFAFGEAALPWLVAAVALAWLALRVWILRNRLALREPDEAPPKAWRWLLALTRARASLVVLALGAAGCLVAAVLVSR